MENWGFVSVFEDHGLRRRYKFLVSNIIFLGFFFFFLGTKLNLLGFTLLL